jgi:tRNA pseudouridine55 synthase
VSKPRRPKRPIDGILLLDKPAGITSNKALQEIKHLMQAEKAGHTGSLDPLATGLLPICLGEASKFSQYLLDADKVYRASMRLGQKTTTADAEGELIAEAPVPVLSLDEIEAVLARFRGDITQVPSMFSALKKDGRPLYELARQGLEVERAARPVSIYRLQLLEARPDSWDIEVACSKGTYVRNLVEDIGDAIGCGAHVTALRRLAAGPFLEHQMVSLDTVKAMVAAGGPSGADSLLQPAWAGLAGMPQVELSETAAYYLLQGQPVRVPSAPNEGPVLAFEAGGRFLGLVEVADDGRLAPKRLIKGA